MSFPRRSKILFHAKMDLHASACKPAPTPLCQFNWLRNLDHPQQFHEKTPRFRLASARHRQLHMINCGKGNGHRAFILSGLPKASRLRISFPLSGCHHGPIAPSL
jgi:hypothetical protein